MCHVNDFNLSCKCLMGFTVHKKLHNLENTNPEFYEELTRTSALPKAECTMKTYLMLTSLMMIATCL